MRVRIDRGQFPLDLDDGTVNLDAEKIFRLAGNRDRSLECDDAVDVRHCRLAHIRIAVPRSAVLPCQAVGSLAVLHDSWNAVIVIRRYAVVVCGFRLRLSIVGLFLLPLREFAFQTVYPCLVCIILLSVSRRILNARRTDFLQQDSVLVFQCPDLRFKIGRLAVCLVQQRIQFRKVEVVFRHRGLHGALLGVGIQRAAALTALVLCRALSERNPVGTGHADGHALASLQFGGVRCLVIVPRTGRYIIGVAVLVFVELRKSDIQLRPKRIQVHRVGIEDFLIDNFFLIPAFAHMDFVCVCLFGLLVFLADDIGTHPIVDAVAEPVVLVVQLLHAVS